VLEGLTDLKYKIIAGGLFTDVQIATCKVEFLQVNFGLTQFLDNIWIIYGEFRANNKRLKWLFYFQKVFR
jgi:hypothetical protein